MSQRDQSENTSPASERQLRLLAVFAHPDDESFSSGGSLAKYATEGVAVALLCATRGEAGQIADPSLATRESLGAVREAELRSACQALGIAAPHFLDYRDSGMAGTPDNEHPACLLRADPVEAIGKIVWWIRRLRPQVVLTSDPQGVYGHPDHIAIHRFTVAAFRAAGESDQYPQHFSRGVEPYTPGKLYYTGVPRARFRKMLDWLAAAGVTLDMGDIKVEDFGVPDELITTLIDVSPYMEVKWRAIECHRTQLPPQSPLRRLPPELRREFLSREFFSRAHPPVPPQDSLETDLFEGLR
jgi:LmbE family N-acetylglucosaminyl deacetylase